MLPLALLLPLATVYPVGPGQPATSLDQVPWESLQPGDTVEVHARPEPYASKWVLNLAATQALPITVRGIADSMGNLPVITGAGATTRASLSYPQADRAIVTIGASTVPADTMASFLVIENLRFRRARRTDQFADSSGLQVNYTSTAAALSITKGRFITVRGCSFEDFEKGIVAGPDVEDLLIEKNVFGGNSTAGEVGSANLELDTVRPVVQFNLLGNPVAGSDAENVRDTSAGSVIRYNFVTGGNRVLALEASGAHTTHADFARVRVYGNVIVKTSTGGNDSFLHFEGVGGAARSLELYQNTFVLRRGQGRLVDITAPGDLTVRLFNNLVRRPTAAPLQLVGGIGLLELGGNWVQTGVLLANGPTVTSTDRGGAREADDPGFVDEGRDDFRLRPGADPIDHGLALPGGFDPPLFEYRAPAAGAARGGDGLLDMGAFEHADAGDAPDGGAPDGGAPDGGAPDGGTPRPARQAGLVGWGLGCQSTPESGALLALAILWVRVRARGRSR